MTPRRLRRDALPPSLEHVDPCVRELWVLGADPCELGPCVAIVGSRRATSYGTEAAFGLAADLAMQGFCIVSGLALGIDGAAHDGALSVGGRTIAVMGCGADVAYPPRNRALYERIAAEGSIVSELPPGEPPRREHFPVRNRIVAGLSRGVILVQARDERSGGMITVRWAMQFGREVFAVPGDIHADLSAIPHQLIREGAGLCAGAHDVVGVLEGGLSQASAREGPRIPPGLDPDAEAVLRAIHAGPAGAEQLAARAGLDPLATARLLVRLELAGHVARAAGDVFRPL